MTLLGPLTPRLSRVAGAAIGDSLEGCLTPLMPMTPRLSRVPPLTPRLSCVAGAALGDSLELGLLDAVDAAPLTPLTPRLSPLAGAALGDSWLSGGLLDAIHAVDATAVLRGRRGTW